MRTMSAIRAVLHERRPDKQHSTCPQRASTAKCCWAQVAALDWDRRKSKGGAFYRDAGEMARRVSSHSSLLASLIESKRPTGIVLRSSLWVKDASLVVPWSRYVG